MGRERWPNGTFAGGICTVYIMGVGEQTALLARAHCIDERGSKVCAANRFGGRQIASARSDRLGQARVYCTVTVL